MALVLTYTTLKAQIAEWAERGGDASLVAQADYIIMLAENQMASECKILGTQASVAGRFIPGRYWIPKPVRWRETLEVNFGTGPSQMKRNYLELRTYGFCRSYWPDPQLTKVPRFYSDYLYDQYLIVPTPDDDYPYEMIFYQLPPPLDATNNTNWWTRNAPEVLHSCVQMRTAAYLKDIERIGMFKAEYEAAKIARFGESMRQKVDRAQEPKEK